MTKASGFSLIELMVVVAIVGILAGIGMPAYQAHMLKAHRADAQGDLLDIAARQERFMAQNNTYTNDISGAGGLNLGSATSREGYYDLTVGICGVGITLATCYLLNAKAIGGQANDTDCADITYRSTGVKSGTTGECW